jgi:hypothetical protein
LKKALKERFISKKLYQTRFLRLRAMFFKGEVADKIFLAGGYRPILQQTIYFKKDPKLAPLHVFFSYFKSLKVVKTDLCKKYFKQLYEI